MKISTGSSMVLGLVLASLAACGGGGGDAGGGNGNGNGGGNGGGGGGGPVALTLSSADPPNGAVNIPRTASPTLTFSHSLNAGSISDASVKLRLGSADVALDRVVNGAVVTLRPQARLVPGAIYSVFADTTLRGTGGEALADAVDRSFTVAPREWPRAITPVENAPRIGQNPAAAIDPKGNVVAVWLQHDGTRLSLYGAYRDVQTGWTAPALLENANEGDAGAFDNYPDVAIASDGSAVAVWSQNNGTRWDAWSARYLPGTGWQERQVIRQGIAGLGARAPHVVFDNRDVAHVIWIQASQTGVLYDVHLARLNPSGWEGFRQVNPGLGTGVVSGARMGLDAAGDGICVWRQRAANGRWDLYAANFAASAFQVGAPYKLEDHDGGTGVGEPALSVSANGDTAVAFRQDTGTHTDAEYAILVNGQWGYGTLDDLDAAVQATFAVAMGPNGTALAAWRQQDANNVMALNVRRFGVGTVTNPQTFAPAGAQYFEPSMAMDKAGNATLAWPSARFDPAPASWQVLTVFAPADAIFGDLKRIDSVDVSNSSAGVQVVSNADGDMATAWYQQDASTSNVYVSVFE